ncbi:DMT family transporter [Marinomonas balearica]|uniref:Drug/metabolite transporter (DMT)-like permease n=1 Tax=Marinomonas balearica TaxID=491947 RepID=A0A4V3CHJ1_9GAMM|nr:DMT family transporter [Marinomonas balearica]TDP01873.1 drug/metabolite transporter (DMT)-like permease [Marinomonas balearica]
MTGTFFIIAACFTWALDTLIRYPLLERGYSTLQIVLIEHLTLVLITAPLLIRYRKHYFRLSTKSFASLFFIGGVGSAIGTLAFTQAFQYLNPTVVILLQKLQPIVAILLAYWLLKENIQSHFIRWAGVILLGSFIMMWPDIRLLNTGNLHYSPDQNEFLKGYGYTLIAVFAWGSSTVCGKYLSMQALPANAILSGRFFSGLIVLILFAFSAPESLQSIQTADLSLTVVMALLSGLIGMWLYYQGLKTLPAQMATLAELTFPVFAAAINWVFLDMSLSLYQVAGATLLIAGNIGLRMVEEARTRQSVQQQTA